MIYAIEIIQVAFYEVGNYPPIKRDIIENFLTAVAWHISQRDDSWRTPTHFSLSGRSTVENVEKLIF